MFSLQKGDLDSAVIMIESMNMVLPPDARATLPELPLVQNLADDLLNRKLKYDWVRIAISSVENAISRWVHMNWEKMGMNCPLTYTTLNGLRAFVKKFLDNSHAMYVPTGTSTIFSMHSTTSSIL